MSLIYSVVILIKEIALLISPTLAEIAHANLDDHVRSTVLFFMSGMFGIGFLKKKENNYFLKLGLTAAFLLAPLINVQLAVKMPDGFENIFRIPGIMNILIFLSILILFVPYIFGNRIALYLSKSSVEQIQPVLYFLGLASAIIPSNIALVSIMFGLIRSNVYYFTVLSYIASAIWLIYWLAYKKNKAIQRRY